MPFPSPKMDIRNIGHFENSSYVVEECKWIKSNPIYEIIFFSQNSTRFAENCLNLSELFHKIT